MHNDHDLNLKFILLSSGTLNLSIIDEASFIGDTLKEKETKHISYDPILAVMIYSDSKQDLVNDVADEYKEILQHVDKYESHADTDFKSLLELL